MQLKKHAQQYIISVLLQPAFSMIVTESKSAKYFKEITEVYPFHAVRLAQDPMTQLGLQDNLAPPLPSFPHSGVAAKGSVWPSISFLPFFSFFL